MRYRTPLLFTILFLFLLPMPFTNLQVDDTGVGVQDEVVIDPIAKIDSELIPLVGDLLQYNEWVEVIIVWEPRSGSSLSDFSGALSNIPSVKVKTTFEIARSVLAQIQVGSMVDLARRQDVSFIWANQKITLRDFETGNSRLLAKPSSSSSGFVNFTTDIGAQDLWSLGYNGSNVIIAVLDQGVDITGQSGEYGGDLDDFDENPSTPDYKFVGGVSMVPHEPLYYTDFTGRGTFHAGIATGTGYWNESYAGVAPGANYLNVKVFDSIGITYWSFIISGIDWSLKHGADVILFCGSIPGYYDDPVSIAINNVVEKGIHVVAPAGDEGPGYMSVDTPGQALKALTVGAYNSTSGYIADFSSRGPCFDFRSGPDVIAPGVDLISVRTKVMAESYGNIGGLFNSYGFDLEEILGFSFGTGLPTEAFPTPEYGTPVNDNYTRSSGTGAAAAVVAGAVAILLEAFPLATPELIRIALQKSANSIGLDANTQGAGLIDLVAAYQYLERYYAAGVIETFPISSPLIYPGVVMSADMYNISGNASLWPSNYYAFDTGLLLSTQLMAPAAFMTNISDTNFTSIHLPLNQFGVKFTSEYASDPLVSLLEPVTGERFVWFSQFNVLREMHLVTEQGPMGPEQYMRYAGLLQYEHLLALVTVDQYSYSVTYNELDQIYMINETDWFDVNNRINAFKFNITFFNLFGEPINDLELFSYFKADLFLNETGVLEADIGSSEIGGILNMSLDDEIDYNLDGREAFVTWDENNNTDFNLRYDKNYTAMGFNSTSHAVDAYEVGSAIDLLLNVTLNQALFNTSSYQKHVDDPGFAARYHLTDALDKDQVVSWGGILGFGIGNSSANAKASLFAQMDLLNGNVTTYNVSDVMIVDANFSRIVHEKETFTSGALFLNAGNTMIESLEVVFAANRTNEAGGLEVFSVIFNEQDIAPNTLLRYTAEWVPLYPDVYLTGWAIAQIDSAAFMDFDIFNFNPQMLLLNQETAILNNFFTRNVYVIRKAQYDDWAINSLDIAPGELPLPSFTLHHPGDFGLVNLTCFSVSEIPQVEVTLSGLGSVFVTINQSRYGTLEPYTRVQLLLMIPLLTPQGNFYFNVIFKSNATEILRIPVSISVTPTRGRVLFDADHSGLFSLIAEEDPTASFDLSTTDSSQFNISEGTNIDTQILDRIWGERLETPYGNFFEMKEIWATRPMGATVLPLLPILELNMSDYLDLESAIPEEASGFLGEGEGSLGLGPYSFESDVISLKSLNHDILQFFDLLVIQDPEKPFSEQEKLNITSWVEAGGILLVMAENRSENDVDGLNELLANFNLKLNGNTTYPVHLSASNWTANQDSALFNGVDIISLDNPVNFTSLGGTPTVNFLCDGNYMAEVNYGLGKVLAIGDRDVLSARDINNASNRVFANNCLTWAFERHFDFTINGTDEIPLGKQDYFYLKLENLAEMKDFLDDGKFLALAGFVDENGNSINASIFGFELPVMLFQKTDEGYLGSYYDSTWSKTNYTGTVYVQIIMDHPAAPSEILFFSFRVTPAEPEKYEEYIFPTPDYPHLYDIIGIISVVLMAVFLWAYTNYKNKRRLQITELKGQLLYQARTLINEGKTVVKQADVGLEVEDLEEIDKIRMLLVYRKRFKEYFDELKKFGDKVGETY